MSSVGDLATLKAEGKVTLAVSGGFWGLDDFPESFSDIRKVTGLSDPALSKALKKLTRVGVLERTRDGRYRLNPERRDKLRAVLRPFYSDYYIEQAKYVTKRLRRFKEVVAVVAFGSAAQGKATWDSDLDLLIVLKNRDGRLEKRISKMISDLFLERNTPFEEVFISLKGLKAIAKRELQFLFGIVEGWRCLLDRADIDGLLRAKEQSVRQRYEYDEEVYAWLPRK